MEREVGAWNVSLPCNGLARTVNARAPRPHRPEIAWDSSVADPTSGEKVPAFQYAPVLGAPTLELPAELALREIARRKPLGVSKSNPLDETDPEALRAFTTEYGPLSPTEGDLTELLPEYVAARGALSWASSSGPEPQSCRSAHRTACPLASSRD